MKNRKLQLFTKNQTKDKGSSFGLEENQPGSGAKDSLNSPPSSTLGSAPSHGIETPSPPTDICKLTTSPLYFDRVVFQRNQASNCDPTAAKSKSGSVCWYGDFFFFFLQKRWMLPLHIQEKTPRALVKDLEQL